MRSEKLETLSNSYQQLLGRKQSAQEQVAREAKSVALAKGRLALKPEVNEFMTELQTSIHKRAVGKIEGLLTAILQDVFPGDDQVKIELSSKRQDTSIKVMVSNGEYLEDVMNGRGGSVTNVLSTGLRFIALARSGLTPFIVLDEADCWLKPDKVPAFMSVIAEMSAKLGVQTLVITHHDVDFIKDRASILRLTKHDQKVSVQQIDSVEPIWKDQKGIQEIQLKNFMSHEDTVIKLNPGMTVLTGDNDAGKSAVVTALRAILYGESDESVIRHDTDRCEVALAMGAQGLLSFSRLAKGTRKCRFALVKNGRLAHESLDAKQPEWLAKMGFGKKDKLDIQIGHQKQPVFLLTESGTQQAAILSVGMESKYFSSMEKKYKEFLKEDTDIKKMGEKNIARLTRQIDAMKDLELLGEKIEKAKKTYVFTENSVKQIELLDLASQKIELLEKKTIHATPARQTPPLINNSDSLATIIKSLTTKKIDAKLPILIAPGIKPVKEIKVLGSTIFRLSKKLQKTVIVKTPVEPQWINNSSLTDVLKHNNKRDNLIGEKQQIQSEANAVSDQLSVILDDHDNECLLCGQYADITAFSPGR